MMNMNKKIEKERTKGTKQIKIENKLTYNLYIKIILIVNILTFGIQFVWNFNSIGWTTWVLTVGCLLVYGLCMMTVNSMISSGLDINADSGVAEHIKDIIGITAICQTLSNFHLYFMFIWLVVPSVALLKLWTSIIAPWIFQEGPPEMTDKQKKKIERKQVKRYQ